MTYILSQIGNAWTVEVDNDSYSFTTLADALNWIDQFESNS